MISKINHNQCKATFKGTNLVYQQAAIQPYQQLSWEGKVFKPVEAAFTNPYGPVAPAAIKKTLKEIGGGPIADKISEPLKRVCARGPVLRQGLYTEIGSDEPFYKYDPRNPEIVKKNIDSSVIGLATAVANAQQGIPVLPQVATLDTISRKLLEAVANNPYSPDAPRLIYTAGQVAKQAALRLTPFLPQLDSKTPCTTSKTNSTLSKEDLESYHLTVQGRLQDANRLAELYLSEQINKPQANH